MNILVTICARGGSKGLPNKNIKKINNKHLIYYSIKAAKEFLSNKKGTISLSTDSKKIKDISEKYDLFTDYIRPNKLSGDNVGKVETINHLLNYEESKQNIEFDYILDLDVSSPLRTNDDLNNAYDKLIKNRDALNLFSVSESKKSPYFNMVIKNDNDFYKKVIDISNIKSRQKSPISYDLNASFYFYKRSFFNLKIDTVFSKKSIIYLVPHLCFDIDDIDDFDYMKYLIEKGKIKFKI